MVVKLGDHVVDARSYRVSNLLIWTCVISYVKLFYLRRSKLHFLHFLLDSCITNKGANSELDLACCMHL
jgi:hypothetical protein